MMIVPVPTGIQGRRVEMFLQWVSDLFQRQVVKSHCERGICHRRPWSEDTDSRPMPQARLPLLPVVSTSDFVKRPRLPSASRLLTYPTPLAWMPCWGDSGTSTAHRPLEGGISCLPTSLLAASAWRGRFYWDVVLGRLAQLLRQKYSLWNMTKSKDQVLGSGAEGWRRLCRSPWPKWPQWFGFLLEVFRN